MDDPTVRNTRRKNVLDGGLQNLVPTDATSAAGTLAERLDAFA
jgi:hypothetical protein